MNRTTVTRSAAARAAEPRPRLARILGAGAVVAALAMGLAACGSGSADSATNTPSDDAATASSDPAVAALGGTLRVGTEGTYLPFTFHDPTTNELTGYDIDVITAVAEHLGLEPKFSETKWDSIFAGLEAKRYDIIANEVSANPERVAKYDLTDSYSVSYPVIIVASDDAAITSLAGLKGRTAAQTATSNWNTFATDAGATVQPVDGFTESVAAVKNGRVDFTANDNLAALEYFKTTGDTAVKIGFEVPDDQISQVFALRKDSGLLPAINGALADLTADGTLASIGEKWFGEDISGRTK